MFNGAANGGIEISTSINQSSRLALVYFSTDAVVAANFSNLQTNTQVESAIGAIPYLGTAGVNLEA